MRRSAEYKEIKMNWKLKLRIAGAIALGFALIATACNDRQPPAAPATSEAAPHAPAVADEVCEVVDHALAFHKDDRWPLATAMQRAVRQSYLILRERARLLALNLIVARSVLFPDLSKSYRVIVGPRHLLIGVLAPVHPFTVRRSRETCVREPGRRGRGA